MPTTKLALTKTEPSPEYLLERVADNDPTAFEECVEKYRGLIIHLGRRSMQDASELEDAVQEILLTVWKSAARFDRTRGKESTFIATIARRHFIDRHRRRRHQRAAAQLTPAMEGSLSLADHPEPANEVTAAEILSFATPQERDVLQLLYVADLSYGDAAATLDMPIGTVKSIAHRGLKRLRHEARSIAA